MSALHAIPLQRILWLHPVACAIAGTAEMHHQAALSRTCLVKGTCTVEQMSRGQRRELLQWRECQAGLTCPHAHFTAGIVVGLIGNCLRRHMLQFNPDNYKYYQGLRRALNLLPDAAGKLSDSQREQLSQLYDGLQAQYPRSSAARRIPLDFKVCSAALPVDNSTCLLCAISTGSSSHKVLFVCLPFYKLFLSCLHLSI